MKKLYSFICFVTLSACFVIGACFSPIDDNRGEGAISVRLPGKDKVPIKQSAGSFVPMNRTAISPEAINSFLYELTFSGSRGGAIVMTAGYGETVSIQVLPGLWNVSVRAFDPENSAKIRAIGEAESIDVIAGKESIVLIKMAVYTEVFTWSDTTPAGPGLKEALEEGEFYDEIIMVKGNIATTSGVAINRNKKVTITGENATVTMSGTGSLFTIGVNLEMVLKNITLQGNAGNNAPMVTVNGGKLVLQSGGKIIGNTFTPTTNWRGGAGVFLDGGTLEIAGGEVSGNTLLGSTVNLMGAGIYVMNGGNILMSSGVIRNNRVYRLVPGDNGSRGGGVSLYQNSNFEMTGGIIEDNIIDNGSTSGASTALGGGVSVYTGCSFIFKGGTIRNNECVVVNSNAAGGSRGGGVSCEDGSFMMQGGFVNGNRVSHPTNPNTAYGAFGGGIFIGLGTFEKTGGIVYGNEVTGNDADGIPFANTAQSDSGGLGGGHSVAISINTGWSVDRRRNTTSWANNNMDGNVSGPVGGWE